MSYGVLASKSVAIRVETTSGVGGTDSDGVLDRFQGIWGDEWVSGRLTVTRLHANFIPSRAGRGMAMLDVDLREIRAVELGGGRMSRTMGLRTAAHLVHLKVLGAATLAAEMTRHVEAARKLPQRRP